MRLPLASFRTPYQQPRLLCSPTDLTATPFPRKSRHRSDVKRLPQSAFQLQSKSLTRLTTLLPILSLQGSATVVPTAASPGRIFLETNFLKKSEKISWLADEADR